MRQFSEEWARLGRSSTVKGGVGSIEKSGTLQERSGTLEGGVGQSRAMWDIHMLGKSWTV